MEKKFGKSPTWKMMYQKLQGKGICLKAGSQNSALEFMVYPHCSFGLHQAAHTLERLLISEVCPFSVLESHLYAPRLTQGQVSGICQVFSWDVDGLQAPVKQHNGFLM